ncbi:MAG TPA: glycosyltransferase family 87 protein [Candidatus Limnocylindrales bacterium]|nr:glycosyltransferase family 87 protein [Candidatus Limnocylindrales bacterium]
MTLAPSAFVGQRTRPRFQRPSVSLELAGIVAAVGIWVLVMAFGEPWSRFLITGQDARCYWVPGFDAPYALSEWTAPIAYVYSPAFLQLLAPLKVLAWEPFLAIWTVILLLAVRFLSGPRLFALALLVAVPELIGGNIHLLLAVAIVVGFRYPAAWSLILLTKITPGIGLLWFAVRREWRSLAIALGATAAIVAVSLVIAPRSWLEWFGVIDSSVGKTSGTWAALPIPLWLRLPIAVAVVVWGARTDRRWAVPVAAMLALPALWYGGLTILLAVIPLRDPRRNAFWSPPAGPSRRARPGEATGRERADRLGAPA